MNCVFIVIPVHNRKLLTLSCLSSLFENDLEAVEVVVVDDGSTDGTGAAVAAQFPSVTLLHGDGNLWWAGSVNLGLSHVLKQAGEADDVLLLNDDLRLPKNYLTEVRAASLRHPGRLIGSLDVSQTDDATIVGGGMLLDWRTGKFRNLNLGEKLSHIPKERPIAVSVLTGRGVLIPAEVFRKIGLYSSEKIPQCGDTELTRRAALAGYELLIDPRMIVYSPAEDDTHINHRKAYRLVDIGPYLFDRRSHCHLPTRFWFGMRSNRSRLACWVFLMFDLARVFGHFIKRLAVLQGRPGRN